MRYTIAKTFEFAASHVLTGLPEGHPCGRLHGHNWVITLELGAEELDASGFVLDYRALAPFKDYLDSKIDHQHLNQIWTDMQPCSEKIAQRLYATAATLFNNKGRGVRVQAVRVSETPKTWAEYRPVEHWT